MKAFDEYSQYYDLLYRDKDYAVEAAYVHSLISKHRPAAKTIFEMGCGTGLHAIHFAQLGYKVMGIDRSIAMLRKAGERKRSADELIASRFSFCEGDIRSYRSNEKFDAAVSLFHVMSYMQTAPELAEALATAALHLQDGGVFVFDCWYGPAVLTDRPVSRKKQFENELVRVDRISVPVMNEQMQRVDVRFDIVIENKASSERKILQEEHRMRYLFTEEIAELAQRNSLSLIHAEEWLAGQPLSEKAWNACFVLKKTGSGK